MSLSPAQVRILADTEPFTTILRDLVSQLSDLAPLLARHLSHRRRHRARVVTRRKQRASW